MIHFRCECGQELQTQDEHAGLPVSCPGCGATLARPGQRKPEWRLYGCLAVVLAAFVFALAVIGFQAFQNYRKEVDSTATFRHLKELANAMHAYHDEHKKLPAHAIYS